MRKCLLPLLLIVAVLAAFVPIAIQTPQPVAASTTSTFYSSASDGYLYYVNANWDTTRDHATGTLIDSTTALNVYVNHSPASGGVYNINRSYLFFDTAALPDGAAITSAYISLFVTYTADSETGVGIAVQGNNPDYPTNPLTTYSYDRTPYTVTPYVDKAIWELSIGAYNSLGFFNAAGEAQINLTGLTKFCLRTDWDIDDTSPVGSDSSNGITFHSSEGASPPKLVVTWTQSPVATTVSATPHTNGLAATMNGNTSAIGSDPITWEGFHYGTISGALTEEVHSTSGGIGDFSYSTESGTLDPLTPGTVYFYRVEVTSGAGTTYGTELSFVTYDYPTVFNDGTSSVTDVSATLHGHNDINIPSNDGPNRDRGFCFSEVTHAGAIAHNVAPTATAYAGGPPGTGHEHAAEGTGSGLFSYTLSGLTENTTYYWRSWTNTDVGWTYDAEESFTTLAVAPGPGAPTVETREATAVIIDDALLHGEVLSVNGDNVTTRGFQYVTVAAWENTWAAAVTVSEAAGPYTADNYSLNTGAPLGHGTAYYCRAFATNGIGTSYGGPIKFTTLPDDPSNLTIVPGTTYSSIPLEWTEGASAAKTIVRWNPYPGTYPATPTTGNAGYFGADNVCTVSGLPPATQIFFSIWSWVSGSDVWSAAPDTITGSTLTPPPVNFKATVISSTSIHLWWKVPSGFTGDPNIHTVINYEYGDYPNDPPQAGDLNILNRLTGDSGVDDYAYDNASPGKPYFLGIWFYDTSTSTYSSAEFAVVTTPAGSSAIDLPTQPPNAFTTFDDSHLNNIPLKDVWDWVADALQFPHPSFYGFFFLAFMLVFSYVIAVSTGDMATTLLGTAVVYSAGIAIIELPFWLLLFYLIIGGSLTYVKSLQTPY